MSFTAQEGPKTSAQEDILPARRSSLYLLYHEITAKQGDYGYALTADTFREHLALIRRARTAEDGWLWPEITFDDGHVSNLEQALPILIPFGISAHFFITAGWTSRRPEYMTWQQLAELQRAGQTIGAHGWSHTLLTHCSEKELDTELSSSRQLLEDKLGVAVTTMSLPGGRFNRRVLNACQKAGYTQVFTSIPRAESFPDATPAGRLNLRADASAAWLETVLRPETHLLERLGRTHRLKEAAQRVLGDRMYARLWALLNRPREDAHVV